METIDEKLAVHRAWLEGKQIQVVNRHKTEWNDTNSPVWDWYTCKYRVKPEPVKPAVAKAYVHARGSICREFYYHDKYYCNLSFYTRAPEFDIVAKLPDSSK